MIGGPGMVGSPGMVGGSPLSTPSECTIMHDCMAESTAHFPALVDEL
jgi:hypothetical protein